MWSLCSCTKTPDALLHAPRKCQCDKSRTPGREWCRSAISRRTRSLCTGASACTLTGLANRCTSTLCRGRISGRSSLLAQLTRTAPLCIPQASCTQCWRKCLARFVPIRHLCTLRGGGISRRCASSGFGRSYRGHNAEMRLERAHSWWRKMGRLRNWPQRGVVHSHR